MLRFRRFTIYDSRLTRAVIHSVRALVGSRQLQILMANPFHREQSPLNRRLTGETL